MSLHIGVEKRLLSQASQVVQLFETKSFHFNKSISLKLFLNMLGLRDCSILKEELFAISSISHKNLQKLWVDCEI